MAQPSEHIDRERMRSACDHGILVESMVNILSNPPKGDGVEAAE